MKQFNIFALMAALVVSAVFASCDTSSDTTDSTTSRDVIISSATLGSLRRIVQVNDSTTRTYTVTGSNYPLYIDQLAQRVYNPDSLPLGTRTDKLVFASSNGIVCSGSLSIKSLETGRDTTFSTTDSTDFSQPRELKVWSTDGANTRTYTFDIRVHKQESEVLNWQHLTDGVNTPLAQFTDCKAVIVNGFFYIFGTTGSGNTLLTACTSEDATLDDATDIGIDLNLQSITYAPAVGSFLALTADGHVARSLSAAYGWETSEADFDAIAGATNDSVYAIKDGNFYASADAEEWTLSSKEAGASAAPASNVAFASQSSRLTTEDKALVIVGQTSEGKPSVWRRNQYINSQFNEPWMELPQTAELDTVACPTLQHYSLFAYDEGMVLGGLTDGGTLAPFYSSQDNGRTWTPYEITHPTLSGISSASVTVDEQDYIWIVSVPTGGIYRGRLNRLGWDRQD